GIPYYFYVFAYNSICSGGTLYNLVAPLTGTTTITNPYCLPIYTEGPAAADAIINVTLGTLNNSSSIPATLPAYTFYNAVTIPDLQRGLTASLKVTYSNDPTQFTGVWIDYNQNTIFEAGEGVVTANAGSNGTITIALPVPIGALLGNTRMRIRGGDDAAMLTSQACGLTNSTYGETEDYIVNIINAVTCVAPTTQPTVLTLSPSGTSFTGTFTYASPAADGYLVVRSTSATAPTPVNGTLPAIGASLGGTNVVVDNDTNNSFTATGLTVSTLYYVYVFAYNNYCTGGPTYNLVTPLTGSTTTLAVGYCVPSVTTGFENSVFFSNISFVGTLNDTSNNSTFSSTPLGYQDFTALPNKAIQAQGEGINITTQIGSGRGYTKAWIDWNKDGVFADPGERVYNTAGISTAATVFGFVIPAAQAVGDYRIRIRVSQDDAVAPFDPNAINNFNPCQNIIYFGETEDYLFTVIPSCSANVTSVTNGEVCGSGTVTLGAASTIGGVTGFNWYTTPIGGTAVGSGASFTTPVLATTTNYYARAFSATCEQKVGTLVVAKVSPIPTLNFTPTAPIVCAEEVVFSVTANGDKQELTPINETFNSGLGSFTTVNYISNGATQDAITIWQNRPSTPFVPAQQFWFPAISSGFGGNTFVMTTSDIGQNAGVNYLTHNAIISPAVNTNTYLDLKLTFDMYYSRYFPNGVSPATEFVTVDVSRDGGVTWPYEITRYTSDVGFGSSFSRLTLDLSAHINQPNLKIRFRYNSGWCQGMALDNVKLSGFVPLVTNFTWTGGVGINAYEDAGCTIPFTVSSPAATTIYLKPILSQLEVSNYTFTVNAVLNNGCSAGQTVSVSNKSKVWKGASSTNWNNGLNWAPTGVPDATNCVIIPANTIISGSNYDAFAKNVLVKGTGNLELQSSNNLIVEDFVNINSSGVFNMKDSSNLVQLNPVANVVGGTFNMERISKPMYLFDYTYWSSPLTITTPSKLFTLGNLSSTSPLRYTWIPSVANVSGNWSSATTAVVMNPGGGYIVRAPSTYNSNPAIKANYTANFIGVPNNGDVNTPISHGTMGLVATNDKWNLIGNPYPSAISAEEFLTNTTNTNLIDGTVHFWTHNTPPSTAIVDPFYGDFAINYTATDYSSWNFTGGVATTSGAAPAPNGNIPAGQAFFVRSLGIQPTGTNAVFTNSMRLGATTAYNNSQFYRQNNNPRPASETIEKHRIWLNFTNNSGAFSQVLVGYVQGTTTGYDRGYDGTRFSGNNLSFYSIIPDNSLAIQGRPLPFVDTDIVPLGYNSQLAGNFSIRIDRIDGLFTTQDIFLEDKLLNVVHNLKLTPYTFSTTTGIFNNRFVLRYTDAVLATPDFDYSNSVNVFANNYINVKSTIENIKEILVYDLLGKTLFDSKNIDKKEMILTDFKATQNVLIVKVILDNDAEITKKVIF
ncbi:GEVED domain-containing protein, partial [Flavobacterium sp.]|uniref:GEVED domain-containing protein n=1 Tax=Flavobacterium sp. TaxID=239 RepID=UPI00286D96AB